AIGGLCEAEGLAVRVFDAAAVVAGEVDAAEFEALEGHVADQRMVEDVERAHVGWAFRFEDVHASEAGVGEARAEALVELFGRDVRGDDGGEALVVAMVDELEELLLRPRRRGLRAEVVEDKNR